MSLNSEGKSDASVVEHNTNTILWGGGGRLFHILCRRAGALQSISTVGSHSRSIPFSAFWLRSSVVSVLISLISDTRLIEPHDINLIFLGCGPIRQLAARASARRLGIALPPRLAQPSPSIPGGTQMKCEIGSIAQLVKLVKACFSKCSALFQRRG